MLLALSQSNFAYRRRTMRSRFLVIPSVFLMALLSLAVAAHSQSVRQIPLVRNVPFPATAPVIADTGHGPEFDSTLVGDDAVYGDCDSDGTGITVNRSIS